MTEASAFKRISQYMREAHPTLHYRSIPAGILIDQPIETDWGSGVYVKFLGLVINLQRKGARLTKPNGRWANERIELQAKALDKLTDEGYLTQFACGMEEFKQLV